MMTQIQCPRCGSASGPSETLPVGWPLRCPGCGAFFMTAESDPPQNASRPRNSSSLSDGQVLGIFATIGLALIGAYWSGKVSMARPEAPRAANLDGFGASLPIPRPVPKGSDSPDAVAKAIRGATDPAIRLALVEERRVVFRDSPTTVDCRRLLGPVSSGFKISPAEAARRIIAVVQKTEAEGDRFSPLQVLDAADLYLHSPRFQAGRTDFDSFAASLDEVRGLGQDRSRILERMIQLK